MLEGARYGTLTLRAASLRGGSARYRGEPRRDALLAARFGTGDSALVLVAVASGQRAAPGTHRAARELCEWIAEAVGRNRARLTEDVHTANRGALVSGLHRLTDRAYGRLRADATGRGLAPADYTASVRCLLLPAHPACRTRVFFGMGDGGLFRLRDGVWQDLEPAETEPEPAPASAPASAPSPAPFRFRASVARPGDTLLLCSAGLADPLRGEAALADHLAERWGAAEPPGLSAFLADAQTGVKGYADDRTAVAVWEA
ncbi:protein phosphatase 2C domain-containing protein [Streptomyces hygroscopicus]|uniref:protein phosphatase 2C domain-containing protein n=1 Tax=Streptomyces hygroscopicus TaxID=1912 RepID=UPI0004CC3158